MQGTVLEPDYDNERYCNAYAQTMHSLKMYNTDDSNGLTYDEFRDGYNIYVYDLTADGDIHSAHRSVSLEKGLRLEMKFGKKVTKNINVIILGLFDATMEITKTRYVSTTAKF